MHEGLTPEEELGRVAMALRAEREEEEQRMLSVLQNVPIKQRKAEGLTRGPLTVSRLAFVYGGQPELSLERPLGKYPVDQFTQGTPVFVFRENGDRLKGVVSFVNATVLRVALYGDDFPDDVRSGKWFVDLRFDDKTFFEMEKALNHAINLGSGETKRVRDHIREPRVARRIDATAFTLGVLNLIVSEFVLVRFPQVGVFLWVFLGASVWCIMYIRRRQGVAARHHIHIVDTTTNNKPPPTNWTGILGVVHGGHTRPRILPHPALPLPQVGVLPSRLL